MVLNKFNFELVGKPEDVGMKTGATIHTMNGLKMTINLSTEIPKTKSWWEKQHLKRGLSPSGLPFASEEDAVWGSEQLQTNLFNVEDTAGKCPISRP